MSKQSGGLLLYRIRGNDVQVLLVHPGGPFWAKKDEHAWSIPKGEVAENEDLLEAAKREFQEETSWPAPTGPFHALGSVKASGGKTNHIWAVEADIDVSSIKSNTIEIDWPPRSGQKLEIPEVDKAQWISLSQAKHKLYKGQAEFADQLVKILESEHSSFLMKQQMGETSGQISLF